MELSIRAKDVVREVEVMLQKAAPFCPNHLSDAYIFYSPLPIFNIWPLEYIISSDSILSQ